MKPEKIQIVNTFELFHSADDLLPVDYKLILKAREAAKRAYNPYSGFSVGAALLLSNNEIIQGNNQENAAYPSGTCAERVALFYAASQYPEWAVLALAISVENHTQAEWISPCGACRQVISEYQDRSNSKIRIIMEGNGKIVISQGIDALLPFRFKSSALIPKK
jgi:cytidine deaminase